MEANMSIRTTCGALILGGLLAVTASSMPSLAQTKDKAAASLKDSGTAASKGATANARATPTKHRYWRHRGGQHPHYGSRRVRSQVHTPQ
jgi:hypothetical protein